MTPPPWRFLVTQSKLSQDQKIPAFEPFVVIMDKLPTTPEELRVATSALKRVESINLDAMDLVVSMFGSARTFFFFHQQCAGRAAHLN